MTNDYSSVFHSDKDPLYSPHGYVISSDGTIHTLLKKWSHGIVLAALYPHLIEELNLEIPESFDDIFDYQRVGFDIQAHESVDVIQISWSMLSGLVSIWKSDAACPPAQVEAVRKVMKELGVGLNEEVNTNTKDMTVSKMLKWLAVEGIYNSVWDE